MQPGFISSLPPGLLFIISDMYYIQAKNYVKPHRLFETIYIQSCQNSVEISDTIVYNATDI